MQQGPRSGPGKGCAFAWRLSIWRPAQVSIVYPKGRHMKYSDESLGSTRPRAVPGRAGNPTQHAEGATILCILNSYPAVRNAAAAAELFKNRSQARVK